MPRKIIYLINPISGTRKKTILPELISRKTREQGIGFEIYHTNKEGNYSRLKEKIIAEKITDIVVCGGDGSVSQVTAALMDMPVQFGIIPMGSGNGLALAAGIPTKTEKALQVIFSGTAVPVDGFYINDHFSCMLCGIGLDAQVAHDFALAGRRGLASYVKTTARNFFKARPYPFTIHNKDKNIPAEAFFISIANSNQFGNRFTIAPRASLQDGLLDIVVVKKMNKLRLLFSVLRQVAGNNTLREPDDPRDPRRILYFQASGLTIENPQEAPLHIDGDPYPTAPAFHIRVLPKAFRLLQPALPVK